MHACTHPCNLVKMYNTTKKKGKTTLMRLHTTVGVVSFVFPWRRRIRDAASEALARVTIRGDCNDGRITVAQLQRRWQRLWHSKDDDDDDGTCAFRSLIRVDRSHMRKYSYGASWLVGERRTRLPLVFSVWRYTRQLSMLDQPEHLRRQPIVRNMSISLPFADRNFTI